jgi:hypothetical protein
MSSTLDPRVAEVFASATAGPAGKRLQASSTFGGGPRLVP